MLLMIIIYNIYICNIWMFCISFVSMPWMMAMHSMDHGTLGILHI